MAKEIIFSTAEIARFWSKVDRRGDDECWEWQAYCSIKRYGQFGVWNGKVNMLKAHRVSWEIAHGKIPEGLFVCHKCDNPSCVNPSHLFLGTNHDNMQDMITKGRANKARAERHGSNTHPERLARGSRNGKHTHPEKVARGEQNSSAKLTSAQVVEIRRLRSQGMLHRVIAKLFNISRTQVGNIVRGQQRKQG